MKIVKFACFKSLSIFILLKLPQIKMKTAALHLTFCTFFHKALCLSCFQRGINNELNWDQYASAAGALLQFRLSTKT